MFLSARLLPVAVVHRVVSAPLTSPTAHVAEEEPSERYRRSVVRPCLVARLLLTRPPVRTRLGGSQLECVFDNPAWRHMPTWLCGFV
jgi:hypothetical protein